MLTVIKVDHYIRALAIQKFRSLACKTSLGYLGSKASKQIKRRVEIWMSEEQRFSLSRITVAESE